jgi:tRNA U34 5-methylaminomethyl-2-thiouridine-forming methyltransferase MnmC
MVETTPGLVIRAGGDGSFSLWSEAFREGFHSGRGALREARETFLAPSQLERFPPGTTLRVVEVCVGTGGNLALLLEACAAAGIALEWWGLELDPRPLALALTNETFRRAWQPQTLNLLERLRDNGDWRSEMSRGRLLWGDARQTLAALLREREGQLDLVWHDPFSPRRCPELWTLECLGATARLLAPSGRWISYCSAAAVRETLRCLRLQLVALAIHDPSREAPAGAAAGAPGGPGARTTLWSGGTVASPTRLGAGPTRDGVDRDGAPRAGPLWRELSAMERDHLASAAGEPYRDPTGTADSATILASRLAAQADALARGTRASSSAWRQRWGVGRGAPASRFPRV